MITNSDWAFPKIFKLMYNLFQSNFFKFTPLFGTKHELIFPQIYKSPPVFVSKGKCRQSFIQKLSNTNAKKAGGYMLDSWQQFLNYLDTSLLPAQY